MSRLLVILAVAAGLVLSVGACGEAKKKGNPALLKSAVDLAKQACECVDAGKKGCMSIKIDGKSGIALYMKSDTKDMTEDELKKFGEARSRWNDCGKPNYKPKGAKKDEKKAK